MIDNAMVSGQSVSTSGPYLFKKNKHGVGATPIKTSSSSSNYLTQRCLKFDTSHEILISEGKQCERQTTVTLLKRNFLPCN